ncbi:MAG: ZIP family metal transporter [Caldisericia bacterium]|nr:ZIP family metal transporter [Caldisericia bacterium]
MNFLIFLGLIIPGLLTGLGAIPVLFIKKDISFKVIDALLGFAAGVMLAATFFSLLLPSLERGGILITIFGLISGAIFLSILDKITPHTHFIKGEEGPSSRLRKIWLFIYAITLHNLPEGLAVGVGFGSQDFKAGFIIAAAIGLQNMPEGLAVALPLVGEGYSKGRSLGISFLTGIFEPIMAILGFLLVKIFVRILPFALSFAAGAMLYVISDEIIPESHRRGYELEATFSIIIGFIVMMVLDYLLG